MVGSHEGWPGVGRHAGVDTAGPGLVRGRASGGRRGQEEMSALSKLVRQPERLRQEVELLIVRRAEGQKHCVGLGWRGAWRRRWDAAGCKRQEYSKPAGKVR